ncbi:MAG: hypothetical protein G8345_09300 [Magnetococcales bacterium]|nr:hypothetical protein [Magnetococcales bacterium]NGZ27071.1 hypothetical protein [Magnetococcales bacterium]
MKINLMILSSLVGLLVAGCGNAIFVGTGTSIGLDVEGTPEVGVKASLGYSRTEVVVSPPVGDETINSLGTVHFFNDFHNVNLNQTLATGDAALNMVSPTPSPIDLNAAGKDCFDEYGQKVRKRIQLYTGTDVGFNLSLNAPAKLVFGYKRFEALALPLCRDKAGQPDINSVLTTMNFSSEGIKHGVTQSFATGNAAKLLASNSQLKTAFANLIKADIDSQTTQIQKGKDAIIPPGTK